MTFDRLLYIDRLKDAGVDHSVARAHAEALSDALQETVATKMDIGALRAEIRELSSSVDHRFALFETKLDLTARDLVIKGAGGLIIIATLMIGLKLFG